MTATETMRVALLALEDAERYRWLRSRRSLDLRTDGTHWTASDGTRFVSTHYLAADGTQHAPVPSLDASIDAARAALDAQPEPAPTRHADEDAFDAAIDAIRLLGPNAGGTRLAPTQEQR